MTLTLDGTTGVTTPGITLGSAAITASAAALNSSSTDANSENRIINGDFRIWQRATSSSAAGYVAADRWYNSFVGGTAQQAIVAFALGDTLGAIQPNYFLRQTVSGQTLASQFATTEQHIEGVRSYAGQTITVLGWAKRFSGSGNMAVEGLQNFGTGGSPSATVLGISPTTVTLGTTWAPFAVVMTIPPITGKTLGSNGNDYLNVFFYSSAGADYNARSNSLGLQTIAVDLWGIHIRVGTWSASDAALYRPRSYGTELALCQRYCIAFSATAAINGAYTNSNNFPTTMRVAPSVTLVSGSSAGATWQTDPFRLLQITNSTGASGASFLLDAEL